MGKGLHVLNHPSKASIGKSKVATGKGKPSPHKRALNMAASAFKHAKDVAATAGKKAASYHPAAHAPLVPLAHVGTHPNGTAILGTPHPLAPKQRAAVEKHINAIARHHAAVTNTATQAHKLAQTAKVLASSAAKAGTPIKNLGKRGSKYILGVDMASHEAAVAEGLAAAGIVQPHPMAPAAEHQQYAAAVNAVIGIVLGADPDSSNPGFLTDGTIDPAYLNSAAQGGAIDPTQWGLPALTPDYTGLDGANPDPNLTPLPTRGGTLSDADAAKVWPNVPADGVVYDDVTLGLPDGSVGSRQWFKTPYAVDGDGILKSSGNASGYIWTRRGTHFGSNVGTPRWMAQNGDSEVHDVNDDGTVKDFGFTDALKTGLTMLIPVAGGIMAPIDLGQAITGGGDVKTAKVAAQSIAQGWGPLIGRRDGPLAGLQFAVADGKWFWQSQNAPANMTAAADSALADINANLLKTDNAVIDTTNATITQDATQMAEDFAKQQAAQALAEGNAVSQANIAQVQQGTQAAQQDLDQQKAQAQFDLATQQAQLAMAQQQAQIDAQSQQAMIPIYAQQAQAQIQQDAAAQQAWLDYVKANPDAAFGPQAPQGGFDPSQMAFDPSQGFDMSAYYGVDPNAQPVYDGSGGSFDFNPDGQ